MLLHSFHLNLKVFDGLIRYPVFIDYKHLLMCPPRSYQLIVRDGHSECSQVCKHLQVDTVGSLPSTLSQEKSVPGHRCANVEVFVNGTERLAGSKRLSVGSLQPHLWARRSPQALEHPWPVWTPLLWSCPFNGLLGAACVSPMWPQACQPALRPHACVSLSSEQRQGRNGLPGLRFVTPLA